MNYQQAQEESFLVPWKATECFSGPDCWCRIIVPVEPIYYTHPESPDIKREFGIVDAGSLDQQTAEYFVHLHNEWLARKRLEEITPSNEELLKMVAQNSGQSNWLNLLGDMQHNESVDGNDIVREVGLHKFKILWSFESNFQAREAFKQWNEQYDEYYNNPENYKDKK